MDSGEYQQWGLLARLHSSAAQCPWPLRFSSAPNWASGKMKCVDIEFTQSGFFDKCNLPEPLFISFGNLIAG
jgi:hypothetical protein